MANEKNISIPKDLADKLSKRAKNKGFASLSSYVTYVLRQLISNLEAEKKTKDKVYSEEDEKKAKEKLRQLGYLD